MLMKESLLFVFTIILLNCMKNECRTIQCYSCSHCANSILSNTSIISTTRDEDQCMKTTFLTKQNGADVQLVHRGASPQCRPYSGGQISILCCRFDFCNA